MFSSVFVPPSLPIIEAFPKLFSLLECEGANVILVAPPGAGKTSSVPLILLEKNPAWLGQGKIILIEPRRVAVKGAASRMAHLYGQEVGQKIGYQTRLERYISSETQIEVVTEGLFIRTLLSDPLLEGVRAVIFDEVHERSLECDSALAFALDVQENFRKDLRLIMMSATLEASLFIEKCRGTLIETLGRSYPVEIRYQPDIGHLRDLPERCAKAILSLWAREEGSILVFLPGIGEIRKTERALLKEKGNFEVRVSLLYGEQPLEEQNQTLSPHAGRRVILATSIAETSLTVPGVRLVVDAGWRRKPMRDPSTGIAKLQTCRISRATAEQRAGRAGREDVGIVVRLWSEMTQRSLPPQEVPEIREADLSHLALIGAEWFELMGTKIEDLPFIEAPPQGALDGGRALVQSLGGLDNENKITSLGQKMVRCGTHPRLAAILCAAQTEEELMTASCLVALLEERDPLRRRGHVKGEGLPVHIMHRLALFSDYKSSPYFHPALRVSLVILSQVAERFYKRAAPFILKEKISFKAKLSPLSEKVGALLAAGFPDRIAQLTHEGRYRLSGGGSARLSIRDDLANEKLLVAVGFHHHKAMEITLAAPLDRHHLPTSLLSLVKEQSEASFDGVSGRVIKRKRLRLGSLILQDSIETANASEASALLLEKILSNLERYLFWSEEVKQFQARVCLAREHYAPHLPDLSFEGLSRLDGGWLSAYLIGYESLEQVKELPLLRILQGLCSYEDLKILDKQLPVFMSLSKGKRMINYMGAVPSIEARAQEFYGISSLPALIGGKIALRAILLSPAGRPQAVTTDLAGFWKNGWHDMRRDMRGRYPKHEWPEDPSVMILAPQDVKNNKR